MNKNRIYLLYPSFRNVGGVHNVIIDLFSGLKAEYDVIVSGYDEYCQINERYREVIPESNYWRLSLSRLLFAKGLLISHHRKLTTKLLLLSLFLKRNIVHVAHNEFFNLKHVTLYPKNIIAVSHRVKNNLVEYFKQDPSRIMVIENGIHDRYADEYGKHNYKQTGIKILFPARITKIKNQVNVVNKLKGKVDEEVNIFFAGNGPLYDELKSKCRTSSNFVALGFVSDMLSLYKEMDYVMLFTQKEGLPICLIEAAMMGKPIICNDVGGNLEIVEQKVNGFLCNSFSELIDRINNLPNITFSEYKHLSENARKTYLDKFNVEIMINKYRKVIYQFGM
ncbi:conserved hypothetical protein [uncultured Desulfatiglans sp.]|nr:conserved hypothetical protein [uncultured Desulfatiglans sp.]